MRKRRGGIIIYHYSITQIAWSLGVPSGVASTLGSVPVVEISLVETHRQEILLVIVEGRERKPERCGNPEKSPRCHVSSHLQPAICPSELSLSCHGPKFMINCLRHTTGNYGEELQDDEEGKKESQLGLH